MSETERKVRRAAPAPEPKEEPAAEREVTPGDLANTFGPDPKHERRLEIAHRCAERFAGRALPRILPHGYAQGVQRLAEWLKITGRDLEDLPPAEAIPAVVRYHWMTAGA